MALPLLACACVHQRCISVIEGDEVIAQWRRIESRELFEDHDLLGQGVAAPAPLLQASAAPHIPVAQRAQPVALECAELIIDRRSDLDSRPEGPCSSAHALTVARKSDRSSLVPMVLRHLGQIGVGQHRNVSRPRRCCQPVVSHSRGSVLIAMIPPWNPDLGGIRIR